MNNTKPTFCINTLLGASLYKDTFWLGAEIREDTLTEKAQGNLLHCNFKNMDLMLGDGRKMCYRPGVIDTIISGKYTTLVLPTFMYSPFLPGFKIGHGEFERTRTLRLKQYSIK